MRKAYARIPAVDRGERVNDIVLEADMRRRHDIVYHVPDGYKVEACPSDVDAGCPLGTFRSHVECSKQEIIVSESFELNPGKYGNDQYNTFREFIRNVAQAYDSAIVLVKE